MKFGIIPASYSPYLLSLLRIAAGLSFLEHGTGKILGFPGHLPYIDQMPAGMLWFTGLIELIGGALMVIGLGTRIVGFILSGFMAAGYFIAHFPHSFFPAINGGEAALLYCFVFFYIASAGPGPFSVDAMAGSGASLQPDPVFPARAER